MALSITGGASPYQLREPSVLNGSNEHRQALIGFQLEDSDLSNPLKQYTVTLEVSNPNPANGAEIVQLDEFGVQVPAPPHMDRYA